MDQPKDARNIEGLRWLAEVQSSHAAQWALEQFEWMQRAIVDRWQPAIENPSTGESFAWMPCERNSSKLILHRWSGKDWAATPFARFVRIHGPEIGRVDYLENSGVEIS